MIILVRVKTRSSKNLVEKTENGDYIVFVKEAAEKGKANKEIVKLLAKYFKVVQSNVAIKSGLSSSNKVIEIL